MTHRSTNAVKKLLRAVAEDRLSALYLLALYLGLRPGELLGLRWARVDLEIGRLVVVQTLQRVNGLLTQD